ncbi:MAG: hypothetical protein ACOH1V_02445 [Stenotrophomonas sp.]
MSRTATPITTAGGMTPIQHHALCLAAGGYWRLADALELVHLQSEDKRVLAIHHAPASRLYVGLGDATKFYSCEECNGTGEAECDMGHMHDCPECDGYGGGGIDWEALRWQTLDHKPAPKSEAIQTLHVMNADEAKALVHQYTRLIDRLQGKAEVLA